MVTLKDIYENKIPFIFEMDVGENFKWSLCVPSGYDDGHSIGKLRCYDWMFDEEGIRLKTDPYVGDHYFAEEANVSKMIQLDNRDAASIILGIKSINEFI